VDLSVERGRDPRRIDLADRGGDIFYMLGDHRGDLWLCQAPTDTPLKDVTRVQPDGTTQFYDADDGVENRILVLREGPRNALYAAGIGPTTYLFRYQPDRDRFINLSRPLPFKYSQNFEVHDLAIDERGLVWMATTCSPHTSEYEAPRAVLQAPARQEVDVIVYDRTVIRYLINRETLDGSVQLLPVTFNKQYRSFLMPRGSDLRRRLDPLLVQRINQTDWQEVLRTYDLEAAN
jgi:hypothetical protein